MEKTRREIMIEQVVIEATNLKKFATPEELAKLDFEDLDPCQRDRCIYGLMTTDCLCDRATELIKKCAARIYRGTTIVNADINGGTDGLIRKSTLWANILWSPIEVFIASYERNQPKQNAKLISFLKSETETLDLI